MIKEVKGNVVRIMYMEAGIPNMLVSRKTFMVDSPKGMLHLRVYLNTLEHKYVVRDEARSEILADGTATSNHKAKIKAKDSLASLGVNFSTEGRGVKESTVEGEA
jgi:hypothetical protein